MGPDLRALVELVSAACGYEFSDVMRLVDVGEHQLALETLCDQLAEHRLESGLAAEVVAWSKRHGLNPELYEWLEPVALPESSWLRFLRNPQTTLRHFGDSYPALDEIVVESRSVDGATTAWSGGYREARLRLYAPSFELVGPAPAAALRIERSGTSLLVTALEERLRVPSLWAYWKGPR